MKLAQKAPVALFLACILMISAVPAGFATETLSRSLTLEGTITAGETWIARAPYKGTLDQVNLRVGDLVEVGDMLCTMDTIKLYAPCDGVVGSVGALPGDKSAYLVEKYGALMYLEPANRLTASANTANAYDSEENRRIHVGETVYLLNPNNKELAGVGRVTSVDGKNYTIEVTEGNLISGNSVSIFRNPYYTKEGKIGSGSVTFAPNIAITGEGTVLRTHVEQGESVRRGDLLMELCGDTGLGGQAVSEIVTVESAGFVLSVETQENAVLEQGTALATIAPLDGLQVMVDVPEADLAQVEVGDTVRIRGATMGATERVNGTVVGISGVASGAAETAYTVYIEVDHQDWMRIGMGVDVYFND